MVRAPARRAGDTGSEPGKGENFSLKKVMPKKVFSSITDRWHSASWSFPEGNGDLIREEF